MSEAIFIALKVFGLGFVISMFMAVMIKLVLRGIRVFIKS